MSIKLIFASTAALALIAGAPAHAAKNESARALAAADAGSSSDSSAKAKDERKTCRYFDNTESRMKRERLCMTREQWKKFEEEQAQ